MSDSQHKPKNADNNARSEGASKDSISADDEQPSPTKPRIDNAEEEEKIKSSNESDLLKSVEQKEEATNLALLTLPNFNLPYNCPLIVGESETSTKDLLDCRHSRPLPLELNCEIFKCLDLLIQRDFISGLGRGIYDMFGQKLHIKLIKRFQWDDEKQRDVVFSEDGLTASGDVNYEIIRGKKGIALAQLDDNRCFSHQIYYFEVKIGNLARAMSIGFAGPGFCAHWRYYWGLGFWLENNGKLVYGNETSPIEGWPTYGKDDIVGSGCLLSMLPTEEAEAAADGKPRFIMRPFYTLNGQLCSGSGYFKHVPSIPISSKDIEERDIMKPRVCVIGAFEVSANFGHAPFLYNPHKFLAECEKEEERVKQLRKYLPNLTF